MITLTKWTIVFMINYLIFLILLEIFNPKTYIIYLIVQVIDIAILLIIRLWRFVDWNIQSDEDLGIKPGIELF